jgi:hypothetical protein
MLDAIGRYENLAVLIEAASTNIDADAQSVTLVLSIPTQANEAAASCPAHGTALADLRTVASALSTPGAEQYI